MKQVFLDYQNIEISLLAFVGNLLVAFFYLTSYQLLMLNLVIHFRIKDYLAETFI